MPTIWQYWHRPRSLIQGPFSNLVEGVTDIIAIYLFFLPHVWEYQYCQPPEVVTRTLYGVRKRVRFYKKGSDFSIDCKIHINASILKCRKAVMFFKKHRKIAAKHSRRVLCDRWHRYWKISVVAFTIMTAFCMNTKHIQLQN